MAQKASPYAIRLGYNQIWNNYFFPENKQDEVNWLERDKLIRDYLHQVFPDTTQLRVEYNKNNIFIYLYIPEINLVLGENNEKIQKVMKNIYSRINDAKISVKINLIEVKNIYGHAQSIANLISGQLKKRLSYRLIIRDILSKLSLDRETKGIKIELSGRLDGKEIAETKKFVQGKMPLSTIDSNVEIGFAEVVTTYGTIGIKTILYKGKIWQTNKNHANTTKKN